MLWKCCTQYASIFGKLSSGHRTERGQFSFQASRKAMPNDVQTTIQLYSSQILVKECSQFSKPGFNSTQPWISRCLAGFRKGRGTRDQIVNIRWIIKKAREFQKNIYFCFTDYAKAFDCVDHNKLWKIMKEMGIPSHLICLLWNLYAGQEATVRTGQETTDWFQIGKGVHQGWILSPFLLNVYAEYIMWNTSLDEVQAEIKIARRNISNLRYTDDATLMAESEKLKSLLVVKEWKSWLKYQHSKNEDHGIQSHHFMANRSGNNGNSGRL